MSLPARPPRRRATRVLLTGFLYLAFLGSAVTLGMVIKNLTGSYDVGNTATWIILGLVVAWLGPKVSYRRRDGLFGPLFFAVIPWRVAYLPYRDWPPRDDEVQLARYIRSAEFAEEWKPEYAGVWRLDPDGVSRQGGAARAPATPAQERG